ncbi:MAG: cellulase N-terminal Ig-like domain-containing protein, partial [Dysgonamonadaceae bacterium]
MKKIATLLLCSFIVSLTYASNSWIRVNQVGYLEDDVKVAVWISKENLPVKEFQIKDKSTGEVVYTGTNISDSRKQSAFESSARLSFSDFKTPGTYILIANEMTSVPFKIGNDVYAGASEIPLRYMR